MPVTRVVGVPSIFGLPVTSMLVTGQSRVVSLGKFKNPVTSMLVTGQSRVVSISKFENPVTSMLVTGIFLNLFKYFN